MNIFYSCVLTCIQILTQTYILKYMHTYIYTCIYTYIHTSIHTYTHTYIHTYIQSSRVRLPPQAVLDNSTIDESLRGKWWRPEELGMYICVCMYVCMCYGPGSSHFFIHCVGLVDYSQSGNSNASSAQSTVDLTSSSGTEGLYNEEVYLPYFIVVSVA